MTATLTPQQHLTVVKHLASGKTPDVVAQIIRIPRDQVVDIGSRHGYPDTDKLAWAADILQNKLDAAADIPQAAPVPAARPHTTRLAAAPPPVAHAGDTINALCNSGKASPSKRIQALANRILDDTARLRSALDAEQAKHAAKAAQQAEREKARAEVKRLEQQLREAKARASGRKTATVKPKAPRQPRPDASHPCDHPGCGRVFDTAQGVALHRRRTHPATQKETA